jgi:hypothetical protein
MKKYLALIFVILTLNTSYAQSIKKNSNTKFINFVNSFKEETNTSIFDFRRIINNKAPMSKEEALEFVYHTDDTTKLYCVEFDYSNETEEFRGILGTFLWLPNKCLRINMEDYFFIAYNSYKCQNKCLDKLYDCFLNDHYDCFLTLCIVDKGFNLRDSLFVCNDDGYDSFVKGLLNPQNGKVFLNNLENKDKNAYLYIVNKNLKFELVKKGNISNDTYTDDLMSVLEKLEWKKFFLE